ncbi:helix-turn-helix domain-containing protein [Anaeromicrobium sediminis]|uniref:HTH cro/C1-type domain-containing protein n=1 Tax=Anaeromicrobium sediminis TaxID=1478221 RepID=A0A267MDS8_9FIRM|nr:XRE family transcriptional regulator [Anaeromicrobium sediminis]PAB57734.1 hypothetical protein CCE28_18085 [Anaeromicrobium sediminis]
MDKLNHVIGNNLKDLRKSLGYTLDKLSEVTGISKSMLGQIERGESNPTINTLWKICNGLQVSFTSLVDEKTTKPTIISKEQVTPLHEVNSKYKAYPFAPFDSNRKFEVFWVEIEPNTVHNSSTHANGIEEFLLVVEGTIDVTINEKNYSIEKGQMLKFSTDVKHTYSNQGDTTATAYTIISYH